MNAVSQIEPSPLAKLREPFAPGQISKLPKETRNQIDARKSDKRLMVWNCKECGGHHHKDAVHLDYVGHAALTHRLLDTDPEWYWEPVAFGQDGLPVLDRNGGLWIRLTVLGVTRLGYGDADGKQGGNAIKEAIGDALRNAAMRFGAALDLWHKGDLHGDDGEPADDDKPQTNTSKQEPKALKAQDDGMPADAWAKLIQLIEATNTDTSKMLKNFGVKDLKHLSPRQYDDAVAKLEETMAQMAREQSNRTGTQSGDLADGEIPY
ncbi:hypothetical protein WBP06_09300 [Novosphingobium sp. BL-8H]|uniref:hypothetical protein n=1 Tax=Novosphingobium sp. BL-8H TaxID=3127640 RepID=UPI0037582CE2